LAQRGNVRIKGWGSGTLLREVPQVISVRACAPMEFRVRVMMERLGRTDSDTVREEIERFDAARARTLRAYFNVEQEDARDGRRAGSSIGLMGQERGDRGRAGGGSMSTPMRATSG
jgi:Cytidylate kinase-like family